MTSRRSLPQSQAGNSLRICYGCNHLLEFATLNRLPWLRFETWLRFRVAKRIATLIATLVETSVPECFQGLRIKIATLFATLVATTVPERFRFANRVAIRVVIRNPESQPEGPKIRKPGFFLWLRSGLQTGLRTGFRLQFRNPETFLNGGCDQGCDQGCESQP